MVKVRPSPPIERGRQVEVRGEIEAPPRPAVEYPFRVPKEGWTSRTEIYHLMIGAVVVTAVGLSMGGFGLSWLYGIIRSPFMILGSALIFMSVFILHELAHKASAKYFGMWAEFRLSIFGLLLTAISVLSPVIKIISPGAVMIAGVADKRMMGKIALSGPLTNMLLAVILYAMRVHAYPLSLAIILRHGAAISAWMAAFNMIPFSVFDGAKVLWWSRTVWAAGFAASIVISIITIFI